ncbi:hypothetical protein BDY24DRAFT_413549 [Mrakia frigida]|uniref:uncharacterized protein n=1 Tax=Mrakia frigida TaxID=29902 RepID=UPI003FCBF148
MALASASSPPSSETSSIPSINIGAIVGAAGGVIVITLAGIFMLVKRSRKKSALRTSGLLIDEDEFGKYDSSIPGDPAAALPLVEPYVYPSPTSASSSLPNPRKVKHDGASRHVDGPSSPSPSSPPLSGGTPTASSASDSSSPYKTLLAQLRSGHGASASSLPAPIPGDEVIFHQDGGRVVEEVPPAYVGNDRVS